MAGTLDTINNGDGITVPIFLQRVLVDGLGIPIGNVFSDTGALTSASGDENIYGRLLATFNAQQLQMILTNDQLRRLVEADQTIANFITTGGDRLNGIDVILFNTFKINLGKLQLYAILRKIQQGNCSDVINTLTTALNNKLTIVNEMLETNLQTGGGQKVDDPYFHKYWKYRFKYELAKIEKETL